MSLLGALGIDWKIFLIQVLNFLILFWILDKIFFKRFIAALKKDKEKAIRLQQGEIELQKEREEMKKKNKEIMEETKERTRKILEQARQMSEEEKEKILARTEQEVRDILAGAQKRAEVSIQKIKAEEERIITEKVKETIGEVLSASFSKELHRKYVEEVIEEMVKLDFSKISKKDIVSVTLVSAYSLDKDLKEKISKFLFSKLKNPVFKEKVDPALIAGIRINIDGFKIDGSLEGKIKKAIYQE